MACFPTSRRDGEGDHRPLVQRIFDMEPLDGKMLKGLNEELELADLEEDIQEIGYPVKRED
ncbi:hypothetical protein A9P44_09990 [Paenibacillus polymyxa]|nr:hypothetical protein AV545_15885 [Paenibacillus jamilae]OBA07437.1 hypothetical protein A9P44_09990 [Paenibacillus polymyxa]